MQTLKKILYLLSAREQKKAILLFIMMILMALLDLIGIASVLPFMTVLTNPEIIETNNLYNLAYNLSGIFGIDSNQEFIFALGILVFILLIVSLAFKTLTIMCNCVLL